MYLAAVNGPSELLGESSEIKLRPLEHCGTLQGRMETDQLPLGSNSVQHYSGLAFAEKSIQCGGGRSDGSLTSIDSADVRENCIA